jgi:hypothetical protein
MKVMEQCRVKISNRLAALKRLDGNVDIGGASIKEIIRISGKVSLGHYDLKQHKVWFNEEC